MVNTVDGWPGRIALLVCALSLPAAFPQVAGAQVPDRQEPIPLERDGPQSRWDITASFGWKAPVSNLTQDPESFGTSVTPGIAVGLDGAYWFRSGFGVGLQGFWAPAELNVIATEFQGTIPERLGNVQYFAFSVNALYRLSVGGTASVVQPYFALGAGLRHLGVEAIASPEVEDSTDPALTAALGVFVPVASAFAIRAELRDYASNYKSPTTGESKLQNDIIISIGFTYRIF